MGLRNGEKLNELCPGRCGPSDIDHILHNKYAKPERIMVLEYKDEDVELTTGQQLLRKSLVGDWEERITGRLLAVRYVVLHPSKEWQLSAVVNWVWPPQEEDA